MKTEIVRIPVERERADELAQQLHGARDTYLSEPNCVGLRVLRSTGADEVVAVIDWASEEAHAAANATPAAQSFFGEVQGLAAGAPQLGIYDAV